MFGSQILDARFFPLRLLGGEMVLAIHFRVRACKTFFTCVVYTTF